MIESTHPDGTERHAPNVTDAFAKVSRLSVRLSGLTIVAPLFAAPLLRDRIGALEIVTALGCILLWAAGFLPPLRRFAVPLQLASAFVLLALPLFALVHIPHSRLIIAVNIAITAVFGLSMAPAAAMTAAASGLYLLRSFEPTALVEQEYLAVAPWLGPLVVVVLGCGLLLVRYGWVNDWEAEERRHLSLRRENERQFHESARLQVQATVDRRIHETVLNTLTLAGGRQVDATRDAFRESAADELRMIDRELAFSKPMRLSQALGPALEHAADNGLELTVRIQADPLLDATQASVIRDATIEALRNVSRHSGSKQALLETSGEQQLCIRISDNGRGLGSNFVPGYGIRVSVQAALQSIGGDAQVLPNEPAGSQVILTLPVQRDNVLADPIPLDQDLSRLFRLGLSALAIFGAVLSYPITSGLQHRWPTMLALILYGLLMLPLNWYWMTRARVPLAILTWAVGIAALLTIPLGQNTCMNFDSTRWVVVAVLGGSMLIARTFWPPWLGYPIVGTMIAVGFYVTALTPASCPAWAIALLPWSFFSLAFVFAFTWIEVDFIPLVHEREQLWADLAGARITRTRDLAARAAWAHVDPRTRQFLADFADGNLDPDDPTVQQRAMARAVTLRTRLELDTCAPSGALQLCIEMGHEAERVDAALDLRILSTQLSVDPFPRFIVDSLAHLVQRSHLHRVRLRAFDDGENETIAISAPEECWPPALASELERRVDDVTLLGVREEDQRTFTLLISRPLR